MGLEPRVPGPAMPARYPLSGGRTLLFLMTASLLPRVMHILNRGVPSRTFLEIIVDRQKHLKGGGGTSVYNYVEI